MKCLKPLEKVGDKQLDVGGGRNNLLHTLLLFLHQVKYHPDYWIYLKILKTYTAYPLRVFIFASLSL